jgi:hypothetical protein
VRAVETKHLFRLLVTPSALAYALLGFVGGLLWLSLTSQPAPLAQASLTTLPIDARPLAAPATGRVALQAAIDSVRHLVGEPALLLEGGVQADDGSGGNIYYLESVSPTRGEDIFKVDARTGEVIEATFRGRLAPVEVAADLALMDAEAVAARFARSNFWGFDHLILVDRTARSSDTGMVYSFQWSQVAAESHAELPVSVSVSVMAQSGQVFWYLSQRDPLQVSVVPTIPLSQAVATARAWLGPRDGRWNLEQPAAVRLRVLSDDDGQQRLMWSVQFAARDDEGPRAGIKVLIDAQNGQLSQG